MTEKTNSQKTKVKRDPLGKSFPDIILQTTSQEKPLPRRPETTITREVHRDPPPEPMYLEQVTDGSQKPSNIKIIGSILKGKREQTGLTLDKISRDLCLKISLLKSIEIGEWENLPHKVYVRGYVRKYADLLGVHNEIMPYLTDNDAIQKSQVKPRDETFRSPDNKPLLFVLPRRTPGALLLYALVIILTLGFFLVESKRKMGVELAKLENAVQVSGSVNENEAIKNIPNFTDTKKLIITCHERTWISVIIDGTEKKEFTLKPQEIVILNAKEKFDLLIGNAGGVKLLLDGKDTAFTGEKGQVKRVTLS